MITNLSTTSNSWVVSSAPKASLRLPLRPEAQSPFASVSPRAGGGQRGRAMNCSAAGRLPALLSALLRELRRHGNASAAGAASGPGADASLYILLIMIFYGCLAGGLILAYTRSRKLESKHDPYHLYIERDWGRGGPGQAAEEGGSAEGQRPM
ncbi:potassium voltage-gated channel subfamily E regulatory beta subunit 5 [Apus apus]|uniref:potassium voltage-gated channel subfamily E regulatory beta subunit 5 n=1 Tax=Apus apus TaxID=8895 RepID=UPI0021F8F957|nr:potassium voltage-gated channel subfamily E regulatory beta subunit 5 [Apus apus]